jgi:hypothetical protein
MQIEGEGHIMQYKTKEVCALLAHAISDKAGGKKRSHLNLDIVYTNAKYVHMNLLRTARNCSFATTHISSQFLPLHTSVSDNGERGRAQSFHIY